MNILYMGYFCNDNLFNELVAKGSKSSHARQQLEKKVINGMLTEIKEDTFNIISFLPVAKGVKKAKEENYKGVNVTYLWCDKKNIFSLGVALIKSINSIISWSLHKHNKAILMYSSNPMHVIPAFLVRYIFQIKVITLCSEVSAFRRKDKFSVIKSISRLVSSALEKSFDGYILITENMNQIVNPKKRPYIVMEGIFEEDTFNQTNKEIKKEKAVLYAGGLSSDNGIEILLKGFSLLNDRSAKLWICGDGSLTKMVKSFADVNKNIQYWGVLENKRVRELEKKATLLVNPRFSNGEYTKYSFPSKIMEYMSSGTLTAITRLSGIPEEYFSYAFVLEEENEKGIAKLIQSVMDMPVEIREKLGKEAKEFVKNNKNSHIQATKILNFIRSLELS